MDVQTIFCFAALIIVNVALWRWNHLKKNAWDGRDRNEKSNALVAAVGVSLFLNTQLIVMLACGTRAYFHGLHVTTIDKGTGIELSNHQKLSFYWEAVFFTCFFWGWVFILQVTGTMTRDLPPRPVNRWIFAIGAAAWTASFAQIFASFWRT